MRVESFSEIAGNQRELYTEVVKLLKNNKSIFFIKENITIDKGDVYFLECLYMFESEMLKRRQSAGRDKAREKGVILGRKPKMNKEMIVRAMMMRSSNVPVKEIAIALGVTPDTINKHLRKANDKI